MSLDALPKSAANQGFDISVIPQTILFLFPLSNIFTSFLLLPPANINLEFGLYTLNVYINED